MENSYSLQVCFSATYINFLAGKEALFFFTMRSIKLKAKPTHQPPLLMAWIVECLQLSSLDTADSTDRWHDLQNSLSQLVPACLHSLRPCFRPQHDHMLNCWTIMTLGQGLGLLQCHLSVSKWTRSLSCCSCWSNPCSKHHHVWHSHSAQS